MRKVLSNTQTQGTPFNDVPPNFAVAVILPTGQTMPDNVYLEYAVEVIDGTEVAVTDRVWKRRHPTPFTDDVGAGTSGNTFRLFNHTPGFIYRMVTDTAGIEAVIGTTL